MLVVTGANGFIGSAMVWELNRHGRTDIVCVDTIAPSDRRELLAPLKFEKFMTAAEFRQTLILPRPPVFDGIFHMGACSSTLEMNENYLADNNTQYTRDVFDYCARNSVPLIYASSGAVYGDGSKGFDDATPIDPNLALNPYGRSKSAFDHWVRSANSQPLHWWGLRFFNVYGPNEYFKGDMASVVFKAYHQIRQTGRLKLFRSHHPDYRDGEQMRDFVYVKDVTRWMWLLFTQRSAPSGIYNMGYGTARKWMDLAQAVFRELERPVEIEWIDVPEELRPRYQYFTEAKMAKLLSTGIGGPEWSLESGVSDYVKNYLLQNQRVLS